MSHKEIFTDIYEKRVWGDGSGGGSMPETTIQYRILLQKLMKENNIKSVVDFGCGYFSFSNLVDWTGIKYLGIDCVDVVIESNKKEHGKDNIRFRVAQVGDRIYSGDLLILKDVLQHWTNREVVEFLTSYIPHFKHVLITNSSYQTIDYQELKDGHRPLSAKFYPLKKFNPVIVLETDLNEQKETSLITQ